MTAALQTVYDQAMELTEAERDELVDKLVARSQSSEELRLSDAWMREIERRSREIDDGTAVLIPHEEAMRQIRQKHGF